MKFKCLLLSILIGMMGTGCASTPGQYPIYEPETVSVGVGATDQTLFRNEPHTIGHYGNVGGTIMVTATFRVHPTVTCSSS